MHQEDGRPSRHPVEVPPSEQGPGNSTPPSGAGHETSAADDLADGLDLLLRAARKAVRSLDPRIEEGARRALEQLERFDASTLGEMGRRAAAKVDTKKIDQVAEEAGREIQGILERVAAKIEAAFGEGTESEARHRKPKH